MQIQPKEIKTEDDFNAVLDDLLKENQDIERVAVRLPFTGARYNRCHQHHAGGKRCPGRYDHH